MKISLCRNTQTSLRNSNASAVLPTPELKEYGVYRHLLKDRQWVLPSTCTGTSLQVSQHHGIYDTNSILESDFAVVAHFLYLTTFVPHDNILRPAPVGETKRLLRFTRDFPIGTVISDITRCQLRSPAFAFYGDPSKRIPAVGIEAGLYENKRAFAVAIACVKAFLKAAGLSRITLWSAEGRCASAVMLQVDL